MTTTARAAVVGAARVPDVATLAGARVPDAAAPGAMVDVATAVETVPRADGPTAGAVVPPASAAALEPIATPVHDPNEPSAPLANRSPSNPRRNA